MVLPGAASACRPLGCRHLPIGPPVHSREPRPVASPFGLQTARGRGSILKRCRSGHPLGGPPQGVPSPVTTPVDGRRCRRRPGFSGADPRRTPCPVCDGGDLVGAAGRCSSLSRISPNAYGGSELGLAFGAMTSETLSLDPQACKVCGKPVTLVAAVTETGLNWRQAQPAFRRVCTNRDCPTRRDDRMGGA